MHYIKITKSSKENLIQTTKYTSNWIACQDDTTYHTSSAKDFPHDHFITSCDISIFGMNSHKGLTLREEHNLKLQTTYNYQINHIWITKSSKGNLIQTTKYTSNCIAISMLLHALHHQLKTFLMIFLVSVVIYLYLVWIAKKFHIKRRN